MPNLSKTTKDHDVIRSWAEERGAKPSHVKRTGSAEDVGVLRLDFPGYTGEDTLEPITWEQFFEKFDERNLALVYEDETSGGQKSNFNKIISGEAAEEAEHKRGKRATGPRARSAVSGAGARQSAAQKRGGATVSKRVAGSATKEGPGKVHSFREEGG